MRNLKPVLFQTLCLIIWWSTQAQPLRAQDSLKQPQTDFLKALIGQLAADASLQYGQMGAVVMSAQTGEILASHNATQSLIPASNTKIVITSAALQLLGENFTFETHLAYDGQIKDSVLEGNIYIIGQGDPTLASPYMEGVVPMDALLDSFARAIQRLGIKHIQGHIIGDGSAFEPATAAATWLWEDLGMYYGAGPNGLNFHENLYKVFLNRRHSVQESPDRTQISTFVPHLRLHNETVSAPRDNDDAYIFAAPYVNMGHIRGSIPTGSGSYTVRGALPDPAYFAAWYLDKTLKDKGLSVRDTPTTALLRQQQSQFSGTKTIFWTHHSPILKDIIKKANVESVNLYCDVFLKAIALKYTGYGSNEKGLEEIYRFWRNKGIQTDGLFLNDGSGLSPRNGIQPLQLCQILRNVAQDSAWFSAFYRSLPEPGKTGTVKNMFKQDDIAQQRLRAKSGTLTRVKAYSGYVTRQSGELLVFSVICNNFTCSQRDIRRKLEQFMSDLCRY